MGGVSLEVFFPERLWQHLLNVVKGGIFKPKPWCFPTCYEVFVLPKPKQVALLPKANHLVLLANPNQVFVVLKANQTATEQIKRLLERKKEK